MIFLHLGKVFVTHNDPKPFNIHLANLKKKPRVHTKFEMLANQVKKSKDTTPKSLLIPMMELKTSILVDGVVVTKDEIYVFNTVSTETTANIFNFL